MSHRFEKKDHTTAASMMAVVVILTFGQQAAFGRAVITPVSPQGELSFSDLSSPDSLTFKWRAEGTERFAIEVSTLLSFPRGRSTLRLRGKLSGGDGGVNGGEATYSLIVRNRALNRIVRIARANGDIVFWRVAGKKAKEGEEARTRQGLMSGRPSSHATSSGGGKGQTVESFPVLLIIPNAQIALDSPEHREAIHDPPSLIFNWRSIVTRRINVLVAADASFPDDGTTIKLKVKSGESSLSVTGKKLQKTIAMAERNDNTIYWKVVGKDVGTGLPTESKANRLYINLANEVPVANLAPSGSVPLGDPVTMDGSASFDADGDPLTYEWTLASIPPGSSATLTVADPPGPAFATFTPDVPGDYVIQLMVDDGKQSSAPAVVTLTAELPFATADAGPDQLNVGFGVLVQLDGSASQPSGGGGELTYVWEQTVGPPVNIIGAETATPSFTTPTINELQQPEDRERWRVAYVPAKDTKLSFKMTIVDEKGVSDSDEVVVAMTEFPTSGLQNVGVGTKVFLNGAAQPAYEWSLNPPVGSAAALFDNDTRNPSFAPDVAGTYTVTEANSNQQITINAAKWVGVGGVGGGGANFPQCGACHNGGFQPDKVTGWRGTRHATFFERAIDGGILEYQERCVRCHTVGYDTSGTATNDGFDDAAAAAGWQFPSVLEPGNFDNMPAGPKKLTNIQCENCHGPGSMHSGQTSAEQIVVSFNVGVCAQCHDEPPGLSECLCGGRQFAQWKTSMHAMSVEAAVARDECAGCHTAQGFIQRLRGEDVIAPLTPEPQSCAACHDPHSAANDHQLRSFGDVTLPNGEVVSAGAAAICHECHNSRVDASDPATRTAKLAPHHATQAEMLAGANAQEYGQALEDSFHTIGISAKCVTCHQAQTPDVGEPGRDLIGEHTWSMRWTAGTPDDPTDDVENVAVCQTCHGPSLTTFDRPASGDYDGNGQRQGIQTEIRGLLTILRNVINESLGDGGNPGAFSTDGEKMQFFDANGLPVEPLDSQFFAAYNYFFVLSDGSYGIHNAAYAVQLLQKSYHDLTGSDVPGAVIR